MDNEEQIKVLKKDFIAFAKITKNEFLIKIKAFDIVREIKNLDKSVNDKQLYLDMINWYNKMILPDNQEVNNID